MGTEKVDSLGDFCYLQSPEEGRNGTERAERKTVAGHGVTTPSWGQGVGLDLGCQLASPTSCPLGCKRSAGAGAGAAGLHPP